jgi:hypothetical protein
MSDLQYITEDYYQPVVNNPQSGEYAMAPFNLGSNFGSEFNPVSKHSYIPKGQYSETKNKDTLLQTVKNGFNEPNSPLRVATPQVDNGNLQLQLAASTDLDETLSPNDFQLSGSSNEASSPTLKSHGANKTTKRERARSHTPRPSNSFILYRREKHLEIMGQYKGVKTLNNNVISKIVANMWRSESAEVKAHFAALADAEKRAHMLKYPDYKYRPRKSVSKKSPVKKNPPTGGKDTKMVMNQSMNMQGNNYSANSNMFPMMPQKHMGYAMHHQMVNMQPNPYHHIQIMGGNSQLPMVDNEMEHQYDLMGGEHLGMTQPFPSNDEFLGHDALLAQNTYGQSWPLNPSSGVWDLELDQKPFERMPE